MFTNCLSQSQESTINELLHKYKEFVELDKFLDFIVKNNKINRPIHEFMVNLKELKQANKFMKSKSEFHNKYLLLGNSIYEKEWNRIVTEPNLDKRYTSIQQIISRKGIKKENEYIEYCINVFTDKFSDLNKWWTNNEYFIYCKINKETEKFKGSSTIKGLYQFRGKLDFEYIKNLFLPNSIFIQTNCDECISEYGNDFYEFGNLNQPDRFIYFKQDPKVKMCCEHYNSICKCAYKSNLEREAIYKDLIINWGSKEIGGYYCKNCNEWLADLELSSFDGYNKDGGLLVHRELVQSKPEVYQPRTLLEKEIYSILLTLQLEFDIELTRGDIVTIIKKLDYKLNEDKIYDPIITNFIQLVNDKNLFGDNDPEEMKEYLDESKSWLFKIQQNPIFSNIKESYQTYNSNIPINIIILNDLVKLYISKLETKESLDKIQKIEQSHSDEGGNKLSVSIIVGEKIEERIKSKKGELVKLNNNVKISNTRINKLNALLKKSPADSIKIPQYIELKRKTEANKLNIESKIDKMTKEMDFLITNKLENDEIITKLSNLKDNKAILMNLMRKNSSDDRLFNKLIDSFRLNLKVLKIIRNYLDLYVDAYYNNIKTEVYLTSSLFYMMLVVSYPEYDPDILHSRALGKKSYGNFYLLFNQYRGQITEDFNFKIIMKYCQEFLFNYTFFKQHVTIQDIERDLVSSQQIWLYDKNIESGLENKKIESKEALKIEDNWSTFRPKKITDDEIKSELEKLRENPELNIDIILELRAILDSDISEKPRGIIDILYTNLSKISDLKELKLILNDMYRDDIYISKPLGPRFIDYLPIYHQLGSKGLPDLYSIINNTTITYIDDTPKVENIQLTQEIMFYNYFNKYHFILNDIEFTDGKIIYNRTNNNIGVQRYFSQYQQIIQTPKGNILVLKPLYRNLLTIANTSNEDEYITQLDLLNIDIDYEKYKKIIEILKEIVNGDNKKLGENLDYDSISDVYKFELDNEIKIFKTRVERFRQSTEIEIIYYELNKIVSGLISNKKNTLYKNLYLIDTLIITDLDTDVNTLTNILYFEKKTISKLFEKFSGIKINNRDGDIDEPIILDDLSKNIIDKYNNYIELLQKDRVADFFTDLNSSYNQLLNPLSGEFIVELKRYNNTILENIYDKYDRDCSKLFIELNAGNVQFKLFEFSNIKNGEKYKESIDTFKSRINIEFFTIDGYEDLIEVVDNKEKLTNEYIQINILIQFLFELQFFSYTNYDIYIDDIQKLSSITIKELQIKYDGDSKNINLISISYILLIIKKIILSFINTILENKNANKELEEFIVMFMENIKIRLLTDSEIETNMNEQSDQQGKFSKLKYNQMTKEEKLTQQLFREFNMGDYFSNNIDDINENEDLFLGEQYEQDNEQDNEQEGDEEVLLGIGKEDDEYYDPDRLDGDEDIL